MINSPQGIRKQVDEIVRQTGLHNTTLPINRLPAELFIYTLHLSVYFLDQEECPFNISRLHQLAQVCTYWCDTILHTPSLWYLLGTNQDERIHDIILKRNPGSPLMVWAYTDSIESRDTLFEKAVDHAHRWQTIMVNGPYSDSLWTYLEKMPPSMRDLYIELPMGSETCHFELPEGKPLRHLDLTAVSVSWDSPRLTCLQTLLLEQLQTNPPSLSQLIMILSSSPALRRLILREWQDNPMQDLAKDYRKCDHIQIQLPSLTTLELRGVSRLLSTFLLTHIESEKCLSVASDRVYPTQAMGPTSIFSKLIMPSLTQSSVLEVTYTDATGALELRSTSAPESGPQFAYWAKDTPGIDITFFMRDGYASLLEWKSLFHIIGSFLSPIQVCLVNQSLGLPHLVDRQESWTDRAGNTENAIRHFPHEVLASLRSTTSLECTGVFESGPILRYLGTPSPENDGSLHFPCPDLAYVRLTSIDGSGAYEMVEDVATFVRRRYPLVAENRQELDSTGAADELVEEEAVAPVEHGSIVNSDPGSLLHPVSMLMSLALPYQVQGGLKLLHPWILNRRSFHVTPLY